MTQMHSEICLQMTQMHKCHALYLPNLMNATLILALLYVKPKIRLQIQTIIFHSGIYAFN